MAEYYDKEKGAFLNEIAAERIRDLIDQGFDSNDIYSLLVQQLRIYFRSIQADEVDAFQEIVHTLKLQNFVPTEIN